MKRPVKRTVSIRVEVNVTVPILKKHLSKGGTMTKSGRLQASKDLADQLRKQIADGDFEVVNPMEVDEDET